MDVKLLRQFGQRLLSFHSRKGYLGLEGRSVVAARSLAHRISRSAAILAAVRQKIHSATLSRSREPPHRCRPGSQGSARRTGSVSVRVTAPRGRDGTTGLIVLMRAGPRGSAVACWCAVRSPTPTRRPSISPTRPRRRRWSNWSRSLDHDGPSRACSSKAKARSGSTSMKSDPGQGGIATSPSPCWLSPISPPSERTLSGGVDLKDRELDLLPLTVPEVRHLLAGIIARPYLDREQLFRWSEWRRRHQQRARRAHWTRRAWKPPKARL